MQLHSEISKNDFKQICLLFLPGSIVTIPLLVLFYLSVLDSSFSGLLIYFEKHHLSVLMVALILSFVLGFVLENLGSNLEDRLDRKMNKELWEVYLDTKYNEQEHRVVFSYINSVVFRYKMELSFACAFLFFIIEVFFINWVEKEFLTAHASRSILVIFSCLLAFTLWHATLSRDLLNDLRKKFFTYGENNKCLKCQKDRVQMSSNCLVCEQ